MISIILDEQDLMKLQDRLDILKMNSLFNCFSDFVVLYFSYVIRTQIFNTGDIVYKENDEVDNLYMIIKGDFKLLKTEVIRHNETYSSFMGGSSQIDKQFKNLNSRKFKKDIQIAIIQNHQIFGEEFIFNLRNRKFTVRCESQSSQVIIIQKDQFINKLMEFNYSMDFLRKYFQGQIQSRTDRLVSMKDDFYTQNVDQMLKIQTEIEKSDKKQQQKYLNENQNKKYITINYGNQDEEVEEKEDIMFMT